MERGNGILLHITSLPSPYGIGDLGSGAYSFADFLRETGQKYWQVLPLNPTDPAYGNSPYSSSSAFAGNSLLISPELLVTDGFLAEGDINPPPDLDHRQVDYAAVIAYKSEMLSVAYENFKVNPEKEDYEKFCRENSYWLDRFTLFQAARSAYRGRAWCQWPRGLRDGEPVFVEDLEKRFQDEIDREKFIQYIFFKQWFALKRYCNELGIRIIGDIPIYVNYDSADVWTNPGLFKLDENGRPLAVSGVPPDYFSKTGQLWGNPVYRWDVLQKTGYGWWVERVAHNLSLFDYLRIDHFRGLVAYWEVPAGEKTAVNGRWVKVPVDDFLNLLRGRFNPLPIVAEDLGLITSDVKEVMRTFGLPGMKVLLFAFDEDNPRHPYLPHNYENNSIAYTGTHDNNTIVGWLQGEADSRAKRRLFRYLGREPAAEEVHWELVRLVMMSVADVAVFPMQDILGLGAEARMNKPATGQGNWRWRLLPEQLTPAVREKLGEMTVIYGRS